jgi:hypothetical protein
MLIFFALLGCNPAATAADLCRERRTALDALYADYGGSEIAHGDGLLAGAVQGVDRSRFEAMCAELGKGGKPTALGTKAKDFLAKESTARACTRVVELEAQVAEINSGLPEAKRVTCN